MAQGRALSSIIPFKGHFGPALSWWVLALGWLLWTVGASGAAEPDLGFFLQSIDGSVALSTNGVSANLSHLVQPLSLEPGDLLTTSNRSRARLRNIHQILQMDIQTRAEIQPPTNRPHLFLRYGNIYYVTRGKQVDLQVETPYASADIHGTEFHLSVTAEGKTVLSLIDGDVIFGSKLADGRFTRTDVHSRETSTVEPGRPPTQPARIEAVNEIIQWALYYPGVIDLNELAGEWAEDPQLRGSLAAYGEGHLQEALAAYPTERQAVSDDERIYFSALLLSIGQAGQAQDLLEGISSAAIASTNFIRAARLASALRTVIAAVKGASHVERPPPWLASEWLAESYYQQGRLAVANQEPAAPWETNYYRKGDSFLDKALVAARNAVSLSPNFGFGWARVAELEFSFGRIREAEEALQKVLEEPSRLSPRNAQAVALKGFLASARNRMSEATNYFEQAISLDSGLGNAWLGLGLCKIRQGHLSEGLADLQIAAVVEPSRSLLRSYLGKAYYEQAVAAPLQKLFSPGNTSGYARRAWENYTNAVHELDLAKQLDTKDPTAWLYSALMKRQRNEINSAVADLQTSKELNDNRRVYRSSLLLDQDRAVRSANLAAVFRDAGMTDVSVREASRAVESDYGNYSAHLFLANSYDALRDPRQVNLRYETPWLSEFLIATLLAPVGASTLSQSISQQEYSRLFEGDHLGLSAYTQYFSSGDWIQSGSQFGTIGNTAYSLDSYYISQTGHRPNEDLDSLTLWAKVKEQITPQDTLFVQGAYYNYESGDVAQYYDQTQARKLLRVEETQEPILTLGYHHEWQPGVHTLLLANRLEDTLQVTDGAYDVRLLAKNPSGEVIGLPRPSPSGKPLSAPLDYSSQFEAYSIELQQIWALEKNTLILGSRYQLGSFDTISSLSESPLVSLGTTNVTLYRTTRKSVSQHLSTDLQRLSFYAYERWQIFEPLAVMGGVTYDWLTFPQNYRTPPISDREETTDQVSPKAGLVWTPGSNTVIRTSYSRSLGGVSFDQSFRLEPTQMAGFNQAYRSLISESEVGSVAGASFETWGIALEQKFSPATYVAVEAELLKSDLDRAVGVVDSVNIRGRETQRPSEIRQRLEYEEHTLRLSINQLIAENWSIGAQYRLTDSELRTAFAGIPAYVNPGANMAQESILQQLSLFALFNHSSGFFGLFETLWSKQSNTGYSPDRPGDDFWQFNAYAGFRFLQRRAELRLGVLNLTGRDYRLNPLTPYAELPRERTLTASCKFYF